MRRWIVRSPLRTFFAGAYGLSAVAAIVIYGPTVAGVDTASGQMWRALGMFPVMVVGVGVLGIVCTTVVDGPAGRQALWARMRPGRVPGRWWALLALPAAAVLAVLVVLRVAVSPVFAPGVNPFGLAAGLLAGMCEELGWTGFVWPRLRAGAAGPGAGAVVLGVLWGFWHLPVLDHLGVHPHGVYWAPFAAAFVAALVALRVLIARAYDRTGSVLVAQLVHASSTASLVLFSPLGVSPGQEALWYAGYALVLWLAVGAFAVTSAHPRAVQHRPARP